MKKFFCGLTVIFGLSMIFFLFGDFSFKSNNNSDIINGIVTMKITDDYYIEKLNTIKHNLFYCESSSLDELQYIDESSKGFIETDKYIIKFSHDKNFIAYHYNELALPKIETLYIRTVHDTKYSVKKDVFVIYNKDTQEKKEFNKQEEFIKFCHLKSLDLFNWFFVSGIEFESIELTNNIQLRASRSISVPDQLIFNHRVVFEGYISDCELKENSFKFRIKVPDNSSLEFPCTSNSNLKVGDTVIDKLFKGLVLLFPVYEEIYFDEIVEIDVNTGQVINS